MQSVLSQSRSRATVRRVATGALMTTLFVGGTAGTALAATDSAQALGRPTLVESVSTAARTSASGPTTASPTATPPAVLNWSAVLSDGGSVTAVKSTPVRWFEPNQRADTGTNIGGRIALVWAIAAAVMMAGVLGGTLLNRR